MYKVKLTLPINGIFYPLDVTGIKIILVPTEILISTFTIQKSKCILNMSGPGTIIKYKA